MPVNTIFLIALAALVALGFVYFKYFMGNNNPGRNTYFLAGLRFISIFILLLLLINPGIRQTTFEVEKPTLFLAVDQSRSIEYAENEESVRAYVKSLESNPELQERFNIQTFGFGKEINRLGDEEVEFNKTQTNISNALKNIERIRGDNQSALVLITDGNQTVGEDFVYFNTKENTTVFPVVVGDTAAQIDLAISNLNVNKYAFLNNNFPVEIILNYSGNESIESNFELKSGGSILFSKTVNFSPDDNSEIISTTLPANRLGTSLYEAVINPIASEKNIVNNTRKFGVEVIDERTSVLILSSVSHPDLGMFKKSIEQNEQREASIEIIDNYNNLENDDFQLVILYQPNNKFNKVFEDLQNSNANYLIVTGTQTDWNFLNRIQQNFSKEFINQTQEIFPVYNNNFSQFQFEDIGFDQFPPLEDVFGSMDIQNPALSILLFQQVEGIETNLPLLATLETNSVKQGFLFGENLWKWRSQSYIDKGSFEDFDNFTGKLIQYLAGTAKRDRLTVDSEAVYLENEAILITSQFFDQNYVFNPDAQLEIEIENTETENKIQSSMLPGNNRYRFEIGSLEAGDYSFEIQEQSTGISREGSFTVLEYNVEQQFTSANISKLQTLAGNNDQSLFFLDDQQELTQQLLNESTFFSVQKSREKTVPLIDWKILLVLLVLSLGIEWFLRKYFGLI